MIDVYWFANQKKHLSKVTAIESDPNCKFYYKTDALKEYNFNNYSDNTLDELIKNRLLKLRQQHTRLVLWYSGGTDSKTILDCAYRHSIKFDEIIFYDKLYNPYPLYKEEKDMAKKDIEEYRKKINTKITILGVGYETAKSFYLKYKEDWIRQPFITDRFSKHMRYNILDTHPTEKERLLNDNTVHITGNDYPRLYLDDNKWYLIYFDTQEYCTYYLKQFFNLFWDDFDILNWQIYKSINFYETQQNLNNENVQKFQAHNPIFDHKEFKKTLGRIMPTNNYIAYGKQKIFVDVNNDNYECASMEKYAKENDKKVFDIYHEGMKYLKDIGFQKAKYNELIYIRDQLKKF
jgi:hypothetical protein